MIWIQFVMCTALIVVVGAQLSRYADMLAEKTGLGRTWVGGVLLAGAISLPELATGISAVTVPSLRVSLFLTIRSFVLRPAISCQYTSGGT